MDKPQSPQKKTEACLPFDRPFSLYIHWPFCRTKCPYCDFNSHVNATVDEEIFGNALLTEMVYMASVMQKHRPLSSIFFGGGTPSLMPPALVEKLITQAHSLFGFSSSIEITAEANPTSVETKKILEFRQSRGKPCVNGVTIT